jgi:hypothetical protein
MIQSRENRKFLGVTRVNGSRCEENPVSITIISASREEATLEDEISETGEDCRSRFFILEKRSENLKSKVFYRKS